MRVTCVTCVIEIACRMSANRNVLGAECTF